MRFRQSTLKLWMGCPLQVKFRALDEGPQAENFKACFGTIIHYCLEHLNHDLDVDKAKATFEDLWHNPEKLGLNPTVMPKYTTYSGLRTKGLEILDGWAASYRWENRVLVATEHRFLVPFGRHELTGTVDLLEIRQNHKGVDLLRVCDWKTNTRKPSYTELALNIQFTAYTYATLQPEFWVGHDEVDEDGTLMYPGLPDGAAWFDDLASMDRRSIWYHLWTGAELDAGSRGETDFARLYRVCEEIDRAVEADIYVPDISGETCIFCPYVKPCTGIEIPRGADLMEQKAAWA